ncbi:MAG TPA: alpha/beta fold hydrolase [Acidobacteriota bacterium]|nr:alpha/beta fold hydrolase [Acidobacteriota bacterium]
MKGGKQIRVQFENRRGQKIAGILHTPEGETRAGIVLSHCFTCSKDYKILVWLGRALAARGFLVLRFDFAGLGESEGDFGQTTLSDDVDDIETAVLWMLNQGYPVRVLAGHSMGGAAAILAAERLAQIQGIVAIASSAIPEEITRVLTPENREALERDGKATVSVMGRDFVISREFFEDLKRHKPLTTLQKWSGAFLVIHGTRDRIVNISKAEELFGAAPQPKTFFSLAGGDHLLSQPNLAERAAEAISLWFEASVRENAQSDDEM